jgi:hypothetical protein
MSEYNQSFAQLDPPFSNGKFFGLPKYLPGRVNVDDFIFFDYPHDMNPDDYMVALTSIDTSDPRTVIRTIGTFRRDVELPHVALDAYASVYVIPKSNPTLPTYFARLNRGSTYTVIESPRPSPFGTKYEMRRHGILVAGVGNSKLAY